MMAQNAAVSILGSLGFGSGGGMTGTQDQGGYLVNVPKSHSGGLIMHAGGYVPRFHVGGLSSDEVPAILQKVEYVVSRKGIAALDKINSGQGGGNLNVVVQVKNESSQPVAASQGRTQFDGEKYVVGVVLKNIDSNGPLRSAIAGASK